jgi:hypothetical protein
MPNPKKRSIEDIPSKYNFIINPYPDQRLSSCPFCERKTGQRKLPLFIHVDPGYPIALNYTCRYCRHCDLLIAHKHELEHLLTSLFAEADPSVIGNNYLIAGTVDKKAWRKNMQRPGDATEMLTQHTSIFKTYYEELRLTQPGWYKEGVEPPEMPPPPSLEWVKRAKN